MNNVNDKEVIQLAVKFLQKKNPAALKQEYVE